MAHKKRVRCCRDTPACADCPVVAALAQRTAAGRPTRSKGRRNGRGT